MYRFQYGAFVSDIATIKAWTETLETTEDGVDRTCVRIDGHVSAVWSPWTQGTVPVAGVQGAMTAAQKKELLRTLLAEPRQQLLFGTPDHSQPTQDGQPSFNMILISPLFRPGTTTPYPCDAKSGPIIEIQAISEAIGEVTMIVDLKFTTWIQEAKNARAVLSNRWTQTEELDDKFWSRIITQGVTDFRADAMRVAGLGGGYTLMSPDQFAQAVMPAVPAAFQRRAVRRQVSSDGLSLIWSTVDEQCSLLPVNRKIARVHGYFSDQYSPGSLAGAAGAVSAGVRTAAEVIQGARSGGATGAVAATIGVVAGIGAGVGHAEAHDGFAHQVVTLWLRVDGRPDATRLDLIQSLARCASGLNIAGTGLISLVQTAFILANSITQSLDDDGTWAEMFVQFRGSVVRSLALGAFGLAPAASRQSLFINPVNGQNYTPDLTGLGDKSSQNNMVALVPNPGGSFNTNSGPRGAAANGTPPSDNDPTRNSIRTAFLRAADFKNSEDAAKALTNVVSQRTNSAPGDNKQQTG